MKRSIATLLTLAASAMSSSAVVLVAGWDAFTAEPEESSSSPTIVGLSTTATMSAGTGGSWSDWNNNNLGASPDGTFGGLDPSVASASTNVGAGSSSGNDVNLSLNRSQKPGSLVFNLVNNSGSDQTFEGFYFDGAARFTQSAPDWSLSFSGAISGTAENGVLVNTSMSGAGAARDVSVSLLSLGDNVWEAGSTATFTLAFSGGDTSTGSGGGQETLIDNIGITVVPEPTSLSLLALGLGGLMLRRRK